MKLIYTNKTELYKGISVTHIFVKLKKYMMQKLKTPDGDSTFPMTPDRYSWH